MGPEDYDDSSLEAQVVAAPDGVSGSSLVTSSEDQRYAKTMNAQSRREHSPFRFNKRAFLITAGSVVGIVFVVLASVWFFGKQGGSSADAQSDYASQKVDTQTVSGYNELLDKAPSLQVNGQLEVSEGVTLQPSSAPSNPKKGQLYYNSQTNEPYYYNGTKFVSFAPNEIPPHVSSLGGATGSIAVGNGLQVTSNGQLSLTAAVLNSLQSIGNISTNGSVPWKNLTDYPAACAAGQAITKLADSPTCTAFISSATANSRFIQLQNTTPGTAQSGNLNISGTAIAGSFSGNGANLTGLNASNLSTGTIASGRVAGNYSGITGVGNLTVGTWNASTIAVSRGGTGQTTLTLNGVLFGNGTSGIGATAAGATGECLVGNTGSAPTWQSCSGVSGGGVSSVNTLDGDLVIQGTPGQVSVSDNGSDTLTVSLDASVTLLGQTIGLSELEANSVDSSKITDGSISGVDIANDSILLGTKTTGNYQSFTTGGTGITVTGAAGEGSNPTVSVDNTVCRTTGNCTGVSGGAIGGSGTLNTIAMFTPDGFNIGNSILTQSGTTITAAGTLAANFVQGDGSGLTNVNAVTLQGNSASYFTNASNLSSGTVASGRLSGSYTGITGVGTITAGTWNATAIADAYVADSLTIDATGTVNWQALSNYPAACSAGEAITALSDTPTCSAFLTGSAANAAYIQLQATTPGSAQTGNLNISGTAIAGAFSGNGSALTNLNASNVTSGVLNDARLSGNVSLLGSTIALGAETTGNYQAFTTAGSGITVTGSAGVGTSPTIGVDGTVCRTTGNCAGAGNGGGATNSGSQNYLTKTDGSGNLVGSLLYDDGTKIGLGTSTPSYLLDVQGGTGVVAQFSGRVIGADAVNGNEFVTKDQLDAAAGSAAGSGVTSFNALDGDLILQGTAGQIGITDNGSDTLTLALDANVSLLGQSIDSSEIANGTIQNVDLQAGTFSNITGVGTLTAGTWNANTIGVGYGGTGQVSFTTNGILFGNGASGLGATAAGATGECLVGNTGAAPTWEDCLSASGGSGVTSLNALDGGLVIQGTAGKVAISDNGTNTITLDLDANVSLLGQSIASSEIVDGTIQNVDLQAGTFSNITGVGVLTTGTWNATALADAYVDNNITIDATGTVNWQALSSYPAACSAGEAITALNDSPTCSPFLTGSAANSAYVQLQATTPGSAQTGNLNISGTAIAGSFSGNGSGLTNLNASNVASGTLNDARLSSNVSLLGSSIALGSETTGNYQTFTTAGSGITVTGSAGVGTSPTIAVDGTVCRTTGNCAGAGNGGGATNSGSQNYLTKTDGSGNLIGSQVYDDGTGVGIGTATPGYLFDVQGGSGIVAQFSGRVIGADAVNANEFVTKSQLDAAAGAAAGSGVTSLNSLDGALTIQGTAGQLTITDNGSDTLTVALDANVSILGQSIDSSEIVNGTIQNVDLQAGTFGNITGVGALVAGSINWTGNITTTGSINGTTIAGTTLTQNGNQVCDMSGNCGYTGSGTGAGVGSLNGLAGDLVIQGNSQIGVSASSPNISLSIQADSIGDAQLQYNTGQNLTTTSTPTFAGLIIGSGNVGIGTGTPSYRLDVAGTANATTLFQNGNQVCDASGNCDGTENGGAATNAGQENFLTKTDANGNLVSSQIFDDGTKISIGSTSPGYDLQVDGTIQGDTLYQGANQVCDTSGNCGYSGAGSGAGVASVNTLTGDLTIQGNSQIQVTQSGGNTIQLAIQADTIGDTQLQYNTGQNLTTTSTPTFGGLTLNGALTSTSTIQGSQLISTATTGTAPLTVSSTTVVTNLNSDLLDGQHGSYYQNASNINTGTLAVAQGGTGTGTFTQYGILYGNGTSALSSTAAGATGQCLLATTGSAPTWGACTPTTLQGAYDASSTAPAPATILLADSKNFVINAADTGTSDPNILFNLQCTTGCGSNGRFAIQSAGSDVLTVKPDGTIVIGNGSGNITFAGTGGSAFEPVLSGSAQHTKYIKVAAEYAGATLDATNDASCSSANSGMMTSGLDYSAGTRIKNYYNWNVVSGIATTQCYDVVVQIPVPSDWASWTGTPTIEAWGDSTTNASGAVDILGGDLSQDGSAYGNAITIGSANTWQTTNLSSLTNGKYTAGTTNITLRIRMNAKSGANFRIGNITIPYKTKY